MNLPEPIGEAALAFFQKLLGPVAEAGEILSDKIRFYRWKSSLKTIQRAREIARERNLKVEEVPLKFLIPFLEKSSLEEEDSPLLERWAILLSSSANDPSKAMAIYTDILSRLSPEDVRALDLVVPARFLSPWRHGIPETGFDRDVMLEMKEKERAFRVSLRKRLSETPKGGAKYSDQLEEFAENLLRHEAPPLVENVTLRFEVHVEPIHRYTRHFESPAVLDVLVSCGLIYRYEIELNLATARAYIAVIFPTMLGIKFVVACRGDNIFGREVEEA
jgi:hypothetical protein